MKSIRLSFTPPDYHIGRFLVSLSRPKCSAGIHTGTKNVDALSRDGDRYAIKTISGKTVNTGIFAGLAENKEQVFDKKFEYLIIVVLDQDLQADSIYELTWDQFLKFKYWNGGMKGWGLTVNKKLISEAKLIFQSSRAEAATTWRKHLYS